MNITMEQNQMNPPSFGEKLVGISFNPAQDPKVARAKQLCAELSDMINDASRNHTAMNDMIAQAAQMDILKAQMMVVKYLTFNY